MMTEVRTFTVTERQDLHRKLKELAAEMRLLRLGGAADTAHYRGLAELVDAINARVAAAGEVENREDGARRERENHERAAQEKRQREAAAATRKNIEWLEAQLVKSPLESDITAAAEAAGITQAQLAEAARALDIGMVRLAGEARFWVRDASKTDGRVQIPAR